MKYNSNSLTSSVHFCPDTHFTTVPMKAIHFLCQSGSRVVPHSISTCIYLVKHNSNEITSPVHFCPNTHFIHVPMKAIYFQCQSGSTPTKLLTSANNNRASHKTARENRLSCSQHAATTGTDTLTDLCCVLVNYH